MGVFSVNRLEDDADGQILLGPSTMGIQEIVDGFVKRCSGDTSNSLAENDGGEDVRGADDHSQVGGHAA